MKYYIYKDGHQHGPFSIDLIREQLGSGHFCAKDYAWQEGMEHWVPIQSIFPTKPSQFPPAPIIQQTENKILRLALTIVVLLALTACGYFSYNAGVFGKTEKQKEQENYQFGVSRIMSKMSDSLTLSEIVVEGVITLHNGGLGTSDILASINKSKESNYERVSDEKAEISERLGELSNPPASCEKIYAELDELHSIYVSIISGIYNPSGTAREYVSKYQSEKDEYESQEAKIYAMFKK